MKQLLLTSQQKCGGQGVGAHAEKLPNQPAGHPSPGKFEHTPVETLQQLVLAGGHGFGLQVVLVVSTMPLHGAFGAISVQPASASQHTTTGQIPGVQVVPTIDEPTSAQNRGLVTRQTLPQQQATVGPTQGALAQLVCPAWNTVPPLALHRDAVVTMHPAGLQHTPKTVAAQFVFGHPDPIPCHAPPCISHSHCVFTTHCPLARQHAPPVACARTRGASVVHSAHTTHSRNTSPVMVFMIRLPAFFLLDRGPTPVRVPHKIPKTPNHIGRDPSRMYQT